jgi:fosfomycin resistance protein FosX
MVKGLSHITFIVRDLDRMEDILAKVFGARRVYNSGNQTFSLSKERFFLVGGELGDPGAPAPICIAIMEGEPLQDRTYNHVAFKIEEADYEICLNRVRRSG